MSTWHDTIPDGFFVEHNGTSSACFSDCQQYRPILERRVADNDRAILWIGMNPSTADAFKNDPTVKREMDFSAAWGFGRYIKANVCDFRSTDPKGMLSAPSGARSAQNLPIICKLASLAEAIVVCHGVLPPSLQPLALECTSLLQANGYGLQCLGLTKTGMPKHPLYLKATTALQPF